MFADRKDIDRVMGLSSWFDRGARASIFPKFQRWLNSGNLDDETVARETFEAMATPFGDEYVNKARSDYQDWAGGHSAWSFAIAAVPATFGLERVERTDETYTETRGQVKWANLNMRTLGDCACWGVTGEKRSHILVESGKKELYPMIPHNWDYARQSLSLVLGIGVLARCASRYQGQEDIFADADWEAPRTIPLDS